MTNAELNPIKAEAMNPSPQTQQPTEPNAEELDSTELETVAAGVKYSAFNHNQTMADDAPMASSEPQEPEETTAEELGANELERVAGGLKYAGYNHNQNLAE
jgi:hypothetical protein